MTLNHKVRKILLMTITIMACISVVSACGIHGHKYQEMGDGSDYMDNPLEGWTIYLFSKELPEGVAPTIGGDGYLEHRVTNASGLFTFTDLPYNNVTYYVYEEHQSGWSQLTGGIYPATGYYEITLTPESNKITTADFVNWQNDDECSNETAWAAQDEPGVTRFVDKGDWGTYVMYERGDGSSGEPAVYPIYAGQTHLAGHLYVYDSGDNLSVRYVASVMDNDYMEGYTGVWTGLTEYHLQAVDEFGDFMDNGYTTKKGNPIPGQFDYSGEFGEVTDDTGYIVIPINGFDEDIYIGAHSVMCWSGFPTMV